MIDINIDMNRGHLALSNKYSSRTFSISSSILFISYHQCMEINNNFSEEVSKELIDSFQLFYTRQAEVDRSVRQVADKELASNSQHICNEMLALKKVPKPHSKGKSKQIKGTNPSPSENMLNIQLLYNVN